MCWENDNNKKISFHSGFDSKVEKFEISPSFRYKREKFKESIKLIKGGF